MAILVQTILYEWYDSLMTICVLPTFPGNYTVIKLQIQILWLASYTPWPCTALLMGLKKYSAIGNYVMVYSKLTLETVLLEVVKND